MSKDLRHSLLLLLLLSPSVAFGQFRVGPAGNGKFNLYRAVNERLEWDDAKTAAEITNPGWIESGVVIIPPGETVGHLATIPNGEVNRFLANNYPNGGWIGLTDAESFGGVESESSANFPYPALKAGSTELRSPPVAGERGAGWVWVDGSPLQYQSWGGGEPNDGGADDVHEDAAEMQGGAWNDLAAGDSVNGNASGATRAAIQEWDLGLDALPFTITADLRIGPSLSLEGQAFARNTSGQIIPGTQYSVYTVTQYSYLPPVPKNDKGGLQITVLKGNINTATAWETVPSLQGGVVPATAFGKNEIYSVFRGLPAWANGQAPGSLLDYPARLVATNVVAAGGNLDNYSARAAGEVYLKAGTYKFRDGNDDYARLVVNGQTLIDDNAWTGIAGTENGNGGVTPGSEVPLAIASDGWYAVEFNMAEGGGGDNWRLFWDRQTSPDETGTQQAAPSSSNIGGTDWHQVPAGLLRQKEAPATNLLVQRLLSAPDPGYGIVVPSLTGTDLGLPGAFEQLANCNSPVHIPIGKSPSLRIVASFGGVRASKEIPVDQIVEHNFCSVNTQKGDFNCNGRVDISDFGILRVNFNKRIDSGNSCFAEAIPEPPFAGWAAFAALAALVVRRFQMQWHLSLWQCQR